MILLFLVKQNIDNWSSKIQRIIAYERYDDEEDFELQLVWRNIFTAIATAVVVKKAEDEGVEHEKSPRLLPRSFKGIVSSIDRKKVVIGSLELLKTRGTIISIVKVIEEYSQNTTLFKL